MALIDKGVRNCIANALKDSGIEYDEKYIKTIERNKDGVFDITELIKNSSANNSKEKLEELARKLPFRIQDLHSNICTTRAGDDGKVTISIGEHLIDIAYEIEKQ